VRRHAKASFAGSTQGSGMRRGLFGLVCLCVLGLAAFLGISAPAAGAAACPNEAFRSGEGANLPDCRAYELVSPVENEGQRVEIAGVTAGNFPPVGAADGEAAYFQMPNAINEAEPISSGVAVNLIAQRSVGGWSSQQVDPPFGPPPPFTLVGFDVLLALTPNLDQVFMFGPTQSPGFYPEGEEKSRHLVVWDSGSLQLASPGLPSGLEESPGLTVVGLAADGGHAVYRSTHKLTGEGGAGPYLYDWNTASETLTLLAEGAETARSSASSAWNIVSDDGSRVFIAGSSCGTGACALVNGSLQEIGIAGAAFWLANPSGSIAYFTEGGDLWRYDVDTEGEVNLTGGLADEVAGVLGASEDSSRVYFAAEEAGPEFGIYLWTEGGGIEPVVTGLSNSFVNKAGWNRTGSGSTSRVSPNGMHLAFNSNDSLTGYPNEGETEIYTYDAGTGVLSCASCNPSGEPATSGAAIRPSAIFQLSRNVNDSGKVFFSTEEALVGGDLNGVRDAYEYDSVSGGVFLLSTGRDPFGSTFQDASVNGRDVFFSTQQQLVGVDQDKVVAIYDAREGGGLASQNPPPEEPPCTGEACHPESSSPSLAGAASAGFVGKGNISSKQNCNKLGREAKKLSKRAKRLRKNANKAKKAGNASRAKKLNKKSNRLAKQARNKSKSAKKCRKRNKGASK
jgi:hypothetical protein